MGRRAGDGRLSPEPLRTAMRLGPAIELECARIWSSSGRVAIRSAAAGGDVLAGQTCSSAGGGTWSCDRVATGRREDLVGNLIMPVAWHRAFWAHRCDLHGPDGIDVRQQLVREGLAWAFVRYGDVYAPEEQSARETGVGIEQGPAVPPWDYRRRHGTRAKEDFRKTSPSPSTPPSPFPPFPFAIPPRALPAFQSHGLPAAAGRSWDWGLARTRRRSLAKGMGDKNRTRKQKQHAIQNAPGTQEGKLARRATSSRKQDGCGAGQNSDAVVFFWCSARAGA
jgi:hypothetical protein